MKRKNTIIGLMLLGVLLLSIPKIVQTYHYYFQPFEYIAHSQPIIGTTWELEIFENESKVVLLENNGIGLLQLEQLHAPFLLRFEPTNTSRISLHDFEGKLLIVDGEWLSFGALKTEDFFAKTPFFYLNSLQINPYTIDIVKPDPPYLYVVAHHTWSLEKEPYFLFVLKLKDGNVEKISELEGGVGPIIGVAPSMLVVAVREGEGDTISIIDLQEPLNPKRIDLGINISFHATQIEINEGKAYVAGYGGMAIIDISDKNNASLIFEKLEHKAKGLSLVGSYVLLHTWNGIQLYETNALGEVSLVGVFWGFDQITDIAFTEDYLYILDIDGRIFTYLFPEEYKLRKEVVQ